MASPNRLRRPIAAAVALVLGLLPLAAAAQGVVVQPGDTLNAIARRHGISVSALIQANGLLSPDLIYPGQRLTVPGAGSAPVARTVAVPGVYVVQPGDTLFRIATRHGSTVAAIAAANNLTSIQVIYPGQRLVLPGPGGVGRPETLPSAPATGANRLIVVNLASQSLVAYQDAAAAATFPISSGRTWTPTPVGRFRIYLRYRTQRMVGPGYDLPGVPYVQYFVGNYALHGAYWHDLFGQPTSHGCVNLRVEDAAWLWDWAGMGTEVIVQP